MNIGELRTGQGNVEVEGTISELGNTRVFNKYGRELKVADAIFTDDSGSIKLTLWNDDVARFKEGDRIKIINGYISEFQGEKQLTAGKYGRMEKVAGENNSYQDKGEVKEDKISSSIEKGKSKTAVVSKKDKKDSDEFEENIEEMPEEENFRKESEEDLF
jgi:replication factor A1